MKTEIGWGTDGEPFDCRECGLRCMPDEPDACLGLLPGVVGACCGHGGQHGKEHGPYAYVTFENGVSFYFGGHVQAVAPRCRAIEERDGRKVSVVRLLSTWRDAEKCPDCGSMDPRLGGGEVCRNEWHDPKWQGESDGT